MKLIGGDWNPHSAQLGGKGPGKPAAKEEIKKKANKKSAFPSADDDAVGSVASRLGAQESLNQAQKAEILDKNNQINELQKELDKLKMIKGDTKMSELKKLMEDKGKLEKENTEMREFLMEYGLKWVGGSHEREGEFDIKMLQKKLPAKDGKPPKEIDLEMIAKKIEDLNTQAENEKGRFETIDGVRVLAVLIHSL